MEMNVSHNELSLYRQKYKFTTVYWNTYQANSFQPGLNNRCSLKDVREKEKLKKKT